MFATKVTEVHLPNNGWMFWGFAKDGDGTYWFGSYGYQTPRFVDGAVRLGKPAHLPDVPKVGDEIAAQDLRPATEAGKLDSIVSWCMPEEAMDIFSQIEVQAEEERRVEERAQRFREEMSVAEERRQAELALNPPDYETAVAKAWKERSRSGRQVIMVPPDGDRKRSRTFYLPPAKTKKQRKELREWATVSVR